jgi:hypothetical protein
MCRVGLRRGQVGAPKKQGTVRRHWNNLKYGGGTLRFPHAKEFHTKFASPVGGRKRLKNIRLKGQQIINVPGAPICLGLAWVMCW